MTGDQLQKTVDPNIPKPGGIDTFKMIVAKEGMTWISNIKEEQIQQNNNNPIGTEILIEGLESHLLKFEKDNKNNKLKVMVEDRIRRFDFSFDRPKKDTNRYDILYAEGEKGMLSKGPNFRLQIIDNTNSSNESPSIASINTFKGSKPVFRQDIQINKYEGQKLKKYILENF